MKITVKRVLLVVVAALLLAQLVPAERTNPPVSADVAAPAGVAAILRRSCYDCHSNETRWPWYARVAPAKFLVVDHVRVGRAHLNFSEWDRYTASERRLLLQECREEIASEHMPEDSYLWLHGDAELSAEDRDILERWLSERIGK